LKTVCAAIEFDLIRTREGEAHRSVSEHFKSRS
jgi:hypothetical protein